MSSIHENPTFAALTLGCKVNQYETEAICEALEAMGIQDGDIVSLYDLEFEYAR